RSRYGGELSRPRPAGLYGASEYSAAGRAAHFFSNASTSGLIGAAPEPCPPAQSVGMTPNFRRPAMNSRCEASAPGISRVGDQRSTTQPKSASGITATSELLACELAIT